MIVHDLADDERYHVLEFNSSVFDYLLLRIWLRTRSYVNLPEKDDVRTIVDIMQSDLGCWSLYLISTEFAFSATKTLSVFSSASMTLVSRSK